jgi:hypothetical protein
VPSVRITGVPEVTRAILFQRAAGAGQSLQDYLLQVLVDEAAAPSVDELFVPIGMRPGAVAVTAELAADVVRRGRAGR